MSIEKIQSLFSQGYDPDNESHFILQEAVFQIAKQHVDELKNVKHKLDGEAFSSAERAYFDKAYKRNMRGLTEEMNNNPLIESNATCNELLNYWFGSTDMPFVFVSDEPAPFGSVLHIITLTYFNEASRNAAEETNGWIAIRDQAHTLVREFARLIPRHSREAFQGCLLEDVAEWHRDGVPGWKIQCLVVYHFLVYTRAAVWGGVTLLGAKLLGWLGLG